jgi:hypothetical protein
LFQLLIAIILGVAWFIGFFYQIGILYGNCNVDNGCKLCSITLEEDKEAECERLADTQLAINGGCIAIPMANQFNIIQDISTNAKNIIESLNNDQLISSTLYTSLKRHSEVMDAIQGNSRNQMIDPNPAKLRTFFNKYVVGFSEGLAGGGANELSDDLIIAAGLKSIYSFITIGCVLHSSTDFDNQVVNSFSYTGITACACELTCPTNITIVGGTYDVSVEGSSESNGLRDASFVLPDLYVQVFDDTADPPFIDSQATGEMLVYYTDQNTVSHCPTSVFTTTPAKLNGVLFECCTEKSDTTKLAEANAFAGLVLTFAVVITTILFWPCAPKGEGTLQEILKEKAMEIQESME